MVTGNLKGVSLAGPGWVIFSLGGWGVELKHDQSDHSSDLLN